MSEAKNEMRDFGRGVLEVMDMMKEENDELRQAAARLSVERAEFRREIDRLRAALSAAEGERDALRQAHWDMRAAAGFDNDGDPTPEAVVSDFAAMMRDDWKSQIADYKEVLSELYTEQNRHEDTTAELAAARARIAELEAPREVVGWQYRTRKDDPWVNFTYCTSAEQARMFAERWGYDVREVFTDAAPVQAPATLPPEIAGDIRPDDYVSPRLAETLEMPAFLRRDGGDGGE